MSSGYGINGTGRCYAAYRAFEKCMSEDGESPVCYNLRQDYFDCLHGNAPVLFFRPVDMVNLPVYEPNSLTAKLLGVVWRPKLPEGTAPGEE